MIVITARWPTVPPPPPPPPLSLLPPSPPSSFGLASIILASRLMRTRPCPHDPLQTFLHPHRPILHRRGRMGSVFLVFSTVFGVGGLLLHTYNCAFLLKLDPAIFSKGQICNLSIFVLLLLLFFPIATRTWAKLAGVVSGTRSGAVRNRDEGPNSRSACGPDACTPCSTKAARRLWRVRNCHWVVLKRKFSYDPRGSSSIPLFMARTRSADSCRTGPPTVIGGGPICKSSQNRAEDVITGISGHISKSRSTLCAYRFSGHETGRLQSHISRHFDMIPYDDACFLLFFSASFFLISAIKQSSFVFLPHCFVVPFLSSSLSPLSSSLSPLSSTLLCAYLTSLSPPDHQSPFVRR